MSVIESIIFTPDSSADAVLTAEAVEFLIALHHRFECARRDLLAARAARQTEFDSGRPPEFLEATTAVREGQWRVPAPPDALRDRRVELIGPAARNTMAEALTSGVNVFIADLGDASSPTWENMLRSQVNLSDAARGGLAQTGTGPRTTMMVMPRGLHLVEKHVSVDGDPIAASLFDFGLYCLHNARTLMDRGSGPYLCLPKLEGHLEARLWNEVTAFTEDALELDRGSIRTTVQIETISAAFEIDEIIYELRERICGLGAGRWGYVASIAKAFRLDPAFVLPDRALVGTGAPFMRALTELLVETAHRRGTHAIGTSADRLEARRLASEGFDGTRITRATHVSAVRAEFDKVLGGAPHQLTRQRPEPRVSAADLLTVTRPEGGCTQAGLDRNIDVIIGYLAGWLAGTGSVTFDELPQDASAAELCCAQVWQWVHHRIPLTPGGTVVTDELVRQRADKTVSQLSAAGHDRTVLQRARAVLDEVALAEHPPTFLTLTAYELID